MKYSILILLTLLSIHFAKADEATDKLEKLYKQENLTNEKKVELLFKLLVEYRNVLPMKGIDYARTGLEILDNDSRLDSLYRFKFVNGIGDSYRYISRNEEAIDYYFRALRIAEKLRREKDRAIALNNIGLIYNNIKDFNLALDYIKRSFRIFKQYNAKPLIIQSYNNLASIYWNDNQIDSALKYYNLAFEDSKEINDLVGLLHSYNNLGVVYLGKGDNYTALEFFYRSLEISKDLKDRKGEAQTLNNLGQVFISLEKYNTAASNIQDALSIAQEINAKAIIADSYFYLSKLYENTSDYKSALNYSKLFNTTKDSIYNVEQNRRIQKLHEEYVLQKKDNEIQILQKDKELTQILIIGAVSLAGLLIFIAILLFSKYRSKRKTNQILTELNKQLNDSNSQLHEINITKDKIFTIIAHDLKNPLSGFKNVTSVLVDYYNDMSEEEIKESLSTIKDASNNLMLLLENLLTWAKLQKNEIELYPEKFAINYLVKKYIEHYLPKAKHKNIDIVFNNGEEVYAYGDPNLLSVVIKNLVSNAIKYSKADSKVVIDLQNIDSKANFTITDKGIGIERAMLDDIFDIGNGKDSRFGTEGERGTGIGLILSKSFVEMNDGEIWIESQEGEGTTVSFSVPAKH